MSTKGILGILVGLQLALAAITWWPTGGTEAVPFLDFDRESITEIEISSKPLAGEEPEPVVLARDGDEWVVRSAASYPARSEKIEELLGNLLGIDGSDLVATQSASHNALKVGDSEYGRRIAVTAEGERVALTLGAATSKSINVRREGEDDVFRSSGVSEWTFSDRATNYYDALYVSAPPAELSAIKVVNASGALVFEKEGDGFTLSDLAEGEAVDTEAIDRFLRAITTVRMSEPVGQQVEEIYGFSDPQNGGARVDWTVMSDDQSIAGGYAVGSEIDSDRYAKAVDSLFVVRVASSATERLRSATRSEFLLE